MSAAARANGFAIGWLCHGIAAICSLSRTIGRCEFKQCVAEGAESAPRMF
jgi:hypothetical protein